jgi:hypothetical protein
LVCCISKNPGVFATVYPSLTLLNLDVYVFKLAIPAVKSIVQQELNEFESGISQEVFFV